MTNALRLATLNSVGDFILFLGKLIVMTITGCVGLFIFKQDPDLHLYAAPTLVVCLFAYFVAHCVISLYEVSSADHTCQPGATDSGSGICCRERGFGIIYERKL